MTVSSPVPKVIQQLLTSSSSSSCHFYPPLYLPSITCFRRQFLRKIWPIQLASSFLISCRIFLCSLTLCNTSSFLTWSVQLTFSILLQHHISKPLPLPRFKVWLWSWLSVVSYSVYLSCFVPSAKFLRRKKLLDDLEGRRGYSHLKEEALDRTTWRNRFGRGCGPDVWQITDEWIYARLRNWDERLLASSCLSVRPSVFPHGTMLFLLRRFSWSLVHECLPKICSE
jgi:hypothetical protein